MAKKAESTLPNMLLSLTAIALVAAAALAALNGVTKDPIAAAQQAKVERAISAVLPAFDKLEDQDVDGHLCHVGLDAQGNMVGAAIEAGNDKGFGGHLQLMVGFDAQGNVSGYQILETHETPGLGAKADQWFQKDGKGCVVGSNPAENALTVKKDGGSVDAISGSTITSRAFLGIVNDASAVFAQINNANTTDYED
ncbi:MAG: RnfABCDGE type electron transport complex subunit G [Bacteroidales bacterium]|nr:RnfABCDGE type electron transport complex subunit G [Bacteroidales bacterium]